ncbi:MAG: hypothetical protein HY518_04185 [Candidatus Aenigmarchaeota archaeon]|nr:hypothetical protein [Candidatus Aenigmarchaeota archaeon]
MKLYAFFALAVLLTASPVLAEEYAAAWNGQAYMTESEPPAAMLDLIAERIIAKGITQEYFDSHFRLREASVTRIKNNTWTDIESFWNYTAGNQSANYWVTVQNLSGRIVVNAKTDTLHEVNYLMPAEQAESRLKECGDYLYTELVLTRNGVFAMYARGIEGENFVNMETGSLYCGASPPEQNETIPSQPQAGTRLPDAASIVVFAVLVLVLILLAWKIRLFEDLAKGAKI